MPKEKRWVFLGDTHAEPKNIWTKDLLTKRRPRQWWLNEQFDTALREIVRLSKKYEIDICLGGDMVNKVGIDNREAIVERLLPLKKLGVNMWGVAGTPWHGGEDGEDDRTVYKALGVPSKHINQALPLGDCGRLVLWSHHGAGLGVDPYLGLSNSAKKIVSIRVRKGRDIPDWIVLHHTHEYARSEYGVELAGKWHYTKIAVCPCWQLPNDYSAKRMIWREPSIGYLVYNPHTNEMTPRLFPIPEGVLYG